MITYLLEEAKVQMFVMHGQSANCLVVIKGFVVGKRNIYSSLTQVSMTHFSRVL